MWIRIGFCLILLFINNAAAQPATSTLSGQISGFYGGAVRSATITIKLNSKKTKFEKTTTGDDTGKYLFVNIPPGSYRISATDFNGSTYENPSFDVPPSQTARLDIKIEYGGDCLNPGGNPVILSEEDKARMVNEILRDVLLKNQIAMYEQLQRQKAGIILSGENIKPERLKPLKKRKINLLGSAEITKKAEDGSEFLYLSFGVFKLRGNCVVVPVSNLWAVDTKSRKTPVTGGGKVFVYSKKGSKFKLKTSGRWEF